MGEPFLVNNCHCTMCIKVAHYLDAKAGGISSIAHTTGVAKAMHLAPRRGRRLRAVFGPEGKNVRSYTSCCNPGPCRRGAGTRARWLPAVQSALDRPTARRLSQILRRQSTQGETNPKWPVGAEPKCAEPLLSRTRSSGSCKAAEWALRARCSVTRRPGSTLAAAGVRGYSTVPAQLVRRRAGDGGDGVQRALGRCGCRAHADPFLRGLAAARVRIACARFFVVVDSSTRHTCLLVSYTTALAS